MICYTQFWSKAPFYHFSNNAPPPLPGESWCQIAFKIIAAFDRVGYLHLQIEKTRNIYIQNTIHAPPPSSLSLIFHTTFQCRIHSHRLNQEMWRVVTIICWCIRWVASLVFAWKIVWIIWWTEWKPVSDRQLCRLSFCSYFGRLWQNSESERSRLV